MRLRTIAPRNAERAAAFGICSIGVELQELWDAAMARGGHLRVGLEDTTPLGCSSSNAELVAAAARAVEAGGRRLAPAAEIRRLTQGTAPFIRRE